MSDTASDDRDPQSGPSRGGRSDGEPPAEAVRAQLARILAGRAFSRSERQRRFLKFLVERALDNVPEQRTEYVLATEVFNRKPSFDPNADPIVRVEAGRLRQKLQEYYGAEGMDDPILVDLPPRTYVPVFRNRKAPDPPALPAVAPAVGKRNWTAIFAISAGAILIGFLGYWATSIVRKASPVQSGQSGGGRWEAQSIVVLPFTDLSPNHDQEYFCDGLTDELTEMLSKVGLKVVARTSAFHFKGKAADVREIGRQLNVGLVLEGSVRKADRQLRITAQLIDASQGYHIWSRSYDRELKYVFSIQEEIAKGIAAAVSTELTGRWRARRQQTSTNTEAYELYLKGLHSARDWSTEGLTQAVRELQAAVAADPEYAPAHAALAQYYALLGVHAGLAPNAVMPKARAAAIKALELDSSLAHAHGSLGLVRAVYEWDWQGAERDFRRAIELDPNDPNERQMYVMGYLVPLGRLDEALEQTRQAQSEDPISARTESILGMVFYFRREYDRAIEQLRKPLELDPHFEAAQLALGSAYGQKSRFVEAIASMQEGNAAWRSGAGSSMLGHTYALMGKRVEAQKLIQELVALSKVRYVSPAYIAAIYAGLGDKDHTMEWLRKAYEVRSATLVYLKVNPRFDVMRGDARFTALLKEMHLD